MATKQSPNIVFEGEDGSYRTPQKFSDGALGIDVFTPQDVDLPPFTPVMVNLKLRVRMPKDYGLQIYTRSSLAAKGLTCLGTLIDSDYT